MHDDEKWQKGMVNELNKLFCLLITCTQPRG